MTDYECLLLAERNDARRERDSARQERNQALELLDAEKKAHKETKSRFTKFREWATEALGSRAWIGTITWTSGTATENAGLEKERNDAYRMLAEARDAFEAFRRKVDASVDEIAEKNGLQDRIERQKKTVEALIKERDGLKDRVERQNKIIKGYHHQYGETAISRSLEIEQFKTQCNWQSNEIARLQSALNVANQTINDLNRLRDKARRAQALLEEIP